MTAAGRRTLSEPFTNRMSPMRTLLCSLIITLAVVAGRADEEKLPLDKVPAGVMAGFKKRFPDVKPTEAAKETSDDKKVGFEITFKEKGKNRDVTLTEAVVITTIEKESDARELAKAVRDALDAKYPKATYKMAEEVIAVKAGKEALNYYEALQGDGGQELVEVEVTADNTIKT